MFMLGRGAGMPAGKLYPVGRICRGHSVMTDAAADNQGKALYGKGRAHVAGHGIQAVRPVAQDTISTEQAQYHALKALVQDAVLPRRRCLVSLYLICLC